MRDDNGDAGIRERVVREFDSRYGGAADFLIRAPGRVNLIGEHTDYNDGFVLPMAIDRELWIALRSRSDARVEAHSLDFGDAGFALGNGGPGDGGWIEYIRGVAWALAGQGHELVGWEGVLGGDIPIGAGLSSSAAVEMAAVRAFGAVSSLPWDPQAAALLGQRVENEWIGVNSGIMDQLVVARGQADHAVLIDCRTLETKPVPLPPDLAVVVLDTGTRRGLVGSAYNERRSQCEAAAARCGVRALRDADLALLESAGNLDPVALRRGRHVVTENERTLQAADALAAGDLRRLGQLMRESHLSLRDDFEVSTPALDTIVELAQSQPGCFGARMTGAGFGGCAVAAVERELAPAFADEVTERYRSRLDAEPRAYICRAACGASVIGG